MLDLVSLAGSLGRIPRSRVRVRQNDLQHLVNSLRITHQPATWTDSFAPSAGPRGSPIRLSTFRYDAALGRLVMKPE